MIKMAKDSLKNLGFYFFSFVLLTIKPKSYTIFKVLFYCLERQTLGRHKNDFQEKTLRKISNGKI